MAVDGFFGNIVVIVHEKDVGLNPHPSVIRALVSGSEEKTQCGKQRAGLRMLRIVAANVEGIYIITSTLLHSDTFHSVLSQCLMQMCFKVFHLFIFKLLAC